MPTIPNPATSIYAVVPAAGRSRRMGRDKQLLDIGGRTMLSAVLEPLSAARVEGIALVTRSAIAEAVRDTLPPRTFVVVNDDPATEMIDSIRMGLSAWTQRPEAGVAAHSEPGSSGFLVCPGDHPGITTADFDTCIDAFARDPHRIVIAAYQGRRGHPILFPASLAPFVHSPACDTGLNALPNTHADRVVLIECHSPAIDLDIDTPNDYRPTN